MENATALTLVGGEEGGVGIDPPEVGDKAPPPELRDEENVEWEDRAGRATLLDCCPARRPAASRVRTMARGELASRLDGETTETRCDSASLSASSSNGPVALCSSATHCSARARTSGFVDCIAFTASQNTPLVPSEH
jgi:hypothetical protein